MTPEDLPSLQLQDELIPFLDLIQTMKCKTGIEIGAAGCGTSLLLTKAMGVNSLLVSIDLPESDGGTPAKHETQCRKSLEPGARWALVRGRSTAYDTLAKVKDVLGKRTVDLLLIDAEHTEGAALADHYTYKNLLSSVSITAFHDICMPELWPMWNRLRGLVPPDRSIELIDDVKQKHSGLGIILGRH